MSFLGKGAGVDSSTLETTDAHLKVNVGDKRERSNQVAIDDNVAATSSTDRHVPDSPSEGAVRPLRTCHGLIPSRECASQVALR